MGFDKNYTKRKKKNSNGFDRNYTLDQIHKNRDTPFLSGINWMQVCEKS